MLSANIWIYKIYPQLEYDSHKLALTSKLMYRYYIRFIKQNPFWKQRLARLDKARLLADSLVLDRMIILKHQLTVSTIVYIRVFSANIYPFVNWTLDTIKSQKQTFKTDAILLKDENREQLWASHLYNFGQNITFKLGYSDGLNVKLDDVEYNNDKSLYHIPSRLNVAYWLRTKNKTFPVFTLDHWLYG